MQRLVANLLMYWMLLLVPGATALELAQPQLLLLVPGATALELAQPQLLLPACCRVHGAHHCMVQRQSGNAPAWRGAGCPFANLSHAAILLMPYLPAMQPGLTCALRALKTPSTEHAELSAFLAGLPASRAPPCIV